MSSVNIRYINNYFQRTIENKKRLSLFKSKKKDICLKSVKLKENHVLIRYLNLCDLCLSEYEIFDNVHLTECGHYFHKNCLMEYINSDHEEYYYCPSCRHKINI